MDSIEQKNKGQEWAESFEQQETKQRILKDFAGKVNSFLLFN